MKILIAPDKFKHSLSATEVCQVISATLQEHNPTFEIESLPMADGGEGTAEILAIQSQARPLTVEVHDPLMRITAAQYYMKDHRAFIEMASASGLQLLSTEEQDVLKTTSLGTGEIIKDSIKKGCKEIILCVGGSATSDGGVGMATALGFQFFNSKGEKFIPTAETLLQINTIKLPVDDFIKDIHFSVLTDVTNPLSGKNGASHQYALQKGALAKDLEFLDKGLIHLKDLIQKEFNFNIDQYPGAGAAGGLGGGSTFFLNAKLHSGIKFVAESLDLNDKIKAVDYVISGEGKLDTQSFQGKVVSGILDCCQKNQKPLFLFVGANSFAHKLAEEIKEVFSLTQIAGSQEEAMKEPKFWLEKASFRFLKEVIEG